MIYVLWTTLKGYNRFHLLKEEYVACVVIAVVVVAVADGVDGMEVEEDGEWVQMVEEESSGKEVQEKQSEEKLTRINEKV